MLELMWKRQFSTLVHLIRKPFRKKEPHKQLEPRTTCTLFTEQGIDQITRGVVKWGFALPLEWSFCEDGIVQAWMNMIQME